MKIKLLVIAILMPLLFAGCDALFDEGDVEKTFTGPAQLGFFPLEQEAGQDEGTVTVEVQLIGEQRNSDLSVSFSVSSASTAQSGTHYTLGSTSVTIASGTSTADITINLVDGNLAAGEEVSLVLTLEGASGVEAAANLSTSTVYIQG